MAAMSAARSLALLHFLSSDAPLPRLPRTSSCSSLPRRDLDLPRRCPALLCRSKSDGFDNPPGRSLDDAASASFGLSDWDWHQHPAFTPAPRHPSAAVSAMNPKWSNGWVQQSSVGASGDAAFQGHKAENSLVYRELRDSLGSLDGPGRFFGTGYLPARVEKHPSNCQNFCRSTDSGRESVKATPMSLRILKRKHSRGRDRQCQKQHISETVGDTNLQKTEGFKGRLADVGDSFKSAFSSLVFIIKTLQSHTLSLRTFLFCEELEGVASVVHKELQESFVWLFQQVYSCTPKLMVLTMILLADFSVYSMGKHVAFAAMPMSETPSASVITINDGAGGISKAIEGQSIADASTGSILVRLQNSDLLSLPSPAAETPLSRSQGGNGNGGGKTSLNVGGGTDGDSWLGSASDQSRAIYPDEDSGGIDEDRLFRILWKVVSQNLESMPEASCQIPVLDKLTKHMLVAPVNAELESDDYTCYDRTDLSYQHAITMDPSNPLLLVNYAQFLHLVRRDHNRAEEFFRRAMRADPVDGEVMGRFASFLWVAKGDLAEADRAYSAAVAADPTNSFYAGSYAHFLWNSGVEETACPIIATA